MLPTKNNSEHNTIIRTSKFRPVLSNVEYSFLTRPLPREHCVNINQSSLDPFNPLTPNDPYSGRTAPLTS
jgi:hypothetical protein